MKNFLENFRFNKDERAQIEIGKAYRYVYWVFFLSTICMAIYRAFWASEWVALPFAVLVCSVSLFYLWKRGVWTTEDELYERHAVTAYTHGVLIMLFSVQTYALVLPKIGVDQIDPIYWIFTLFPGSVIGVGLVLYKRIHPKLAWVALFVILFLLSEAMPSILDVVRGG